MAGIGLLGLMISKEYGPGWVSRTRRTPNSPDRRRWMTAWQGVAQAILDVTPPLRRRSERADSLPWNSAPWRPAPSRPCTRIASTWPTRTAGPAPAACPAGRLRVRVHGLWKRDSRDSGTVQLWRCARVDRSMGVEMRLMRQWGLRLWRCAIVAAPRRPARSRLRTRIASTGPTRAASPAPCGDSPRGSITGEGPWLWKPDSHDSGIVRLWGSAMRQRRAA